MHSHGSLHFLSQSDCISEGAALHESLGGIVITDHRLILLRKLLQKCDSSHQRNALRYSPGETLRHSETPCLLSHTHTYTHASWHINTHTHTHNPYCFLLQDVSCLITPSHVNKDPHAPLLPSQNLSVCVSVWALQMRHRRKNEIEKKVRGNLISFLIFSPSTLMVPSHHRVEKNWQKC